MVSDALLTVECAMLHPHFSKEASAPEAARPICRIHCSLPGCPRLREGSGVRSGAWERRRRNAQIDGALFSGAHAVCPP